MQAILQRKILLNSQNLVRRPWKLLLPAAWTAIPLMAALTAKHLLLRKLLLKQTECLFRKKNKETVLRQDCMQSMRFLKGGLFFRQ